MGPKLDKQRAYQMILQQFRESVINGEFKPGQKLPPERELAAFYKVSRATIRETFRALETHDIIEVKHGNGAYVRPKKLQILIEDLSTLKNIKNSYIYEILEFRLIIESGCAALAADRATSEDLDMISKYLEEMAKAETVESGLIADLGFHFAVAKASHNSILIGTMDTLCDSIKESIKTTRSHRFAQPGRNEETLNSHKKIFLAIASRDAELAGKLMKELIAGVRKELALISLEDTTLNNINAKG